MKKNNIMDLYKIKECNWAENLKINQFLSIFQGIDIEHPEIPSERVLAEQNGLKRSDISLQIQMLKSSGLVIGKRGSGNYLQTNDPESIAATAIKNALIPLIHLGYINKKNINDARKRIELLIYNDWCALDNKERMLRILNLEYHAMSMKCLFEENSIKEEENLQSIIHHDILFHETIGYSMDNLFFSILVDSMTQVRVSEIKNFWIKADIEHKEILIQSHFSILEALKLTNKTQGRQQYNIALDNHYFYLE